MKKMLFLSMLLLDAVVSSTADAHQMPVMVIEDQTMQKQNKQACAQVRSLIEKLQNMLDTSAIARSACDGFLSSIKKSCDTQPFTFHTTKK